MDDIIQGDCGDRKIFEGASRARINIHHSVHRGPLPRMHDHQRWDPISRNPNGHLAQRVGHAMVAARRAPPLPGPLFPTFPAVAEA